MSPGATRALKRLGQLVIVGGTLGFVVATLVRHRREIAEVDLLALDVRYLVASAPIIFLYLLGRGLLWHRIANRMIGPSPIGLDIICWLASTLGKYVPGKVFMLLGRVAVYRARGATAGAVTLAFLVELSALFVSAALLFLGSVATGDAQLGPSQLPLIIGAIVLVALGIPPISNGLLSRLRKIRGKDAPAVVLRAADAPGWVLAMMACYGLLGLGLWMLTNAIVPLPLSALPMLTGSFALAGVAGILAVLAPSGLGVREGVLVLALSGVLGPGPAAVLALMARVWMTLGEVTLGLLSSWWLVRHGLRGGAANAASGDEPRAPDPTR